MPKAVFGEVSKRSMERQTELRNIYRRLTYKRLKFAPPLSVLLSLPL